MKTRILLLLLFITSLAHGQFVGQGGRKSGVIGVTSPYNTYLGINAGSVGGGGNYNVGIGYDANYSTGSYNTAVGYHSLYTTTASNNVAIGAFAQQLGTLTQANTAIGVGALQTSTGSFNTALGYNAGSNLNSTGTYNIIIGANIYAPIAAGSNQLSIGNLFYGTVVDGFNTTVSTGFAGIGEPAPARRLHVSYDDATTNAVNYNLRLTKTTSGTAAVGLGTGIEFETENASGSNVVGNTIESVYTDATNASEDSDLTFKGIVNGSLAERLRISGNSVLIGYNTIRTLLGLTPAIQIEGSATSAISLARYTNSSAGPNIVLFKDRTGTAGGQTLISNGDDEGSIYFTGSDGTNAIAGVRLRAVVTASPGTNDMPSDFTVSTTPDGTATPIEVVRVSQTGFTGFGNITANVRVDVNGGLALRMTAPAQITANQNDYAIGAGTYFRINSDAARNITGLTGGFDGKILVIRNTGAFAITFTHQDAASTAANRLLSSTGANIALAVNGTLTLIYDATATRWYDTALR